MAAAARQRRQKIENMFDPEVIARMRTEFALADADGSGEIDADECSVMLAKLQGGSSTPAELKREAESLLRTMDADRNGQISFEEFCFRFGRRYQMEIAAQRRAAQPPPRQRRSDMQREKEEYTAMAASSALLQTPSARDAPDDRPGTAGLEYTGRGGLSRGQMVGVFLVMLVMFLFIVAQITMPKEWHSHPSGGKWGANKGRGLSSTTKGYRPR